ncbi:hypothetical protein COW36_04380 [bacterium (Candidatus Blackallbacteria) CG17_big_fil_post_rev_8_21_14_2_50_48_46]|uniref:Putative manganese efflux pump MntP n=1 Tax=bacterium (Candidatus Blackallbacteria) CG17_big_fil_post_rev_8_21_14_2_50_48_46 TaxID=2014261 RepID=A0A2M7G8U5_9BACT|nr:MAG: hypothetical protein COW64_04565 [bacterium (Candidatus Blackallbacteria) CG18_big_fil_WC_8_21_14_2_50_49_26]PIW18536.1 MAG: hypothetical protein COW36_04380 [bacterium (Candidatus Blackallbacteria) CG17_big_fil_post_rev_8_21_14_2_50_48_46]PIW46479.1 MAG: hypothetical protein COW20_16300 [bacterium (Candidatus Blackallbacteria) CG13_big_fil_rev_8_21_14_2_50_49_14]
MIQSFFLGMSLAMDCFAISLSQGMRNGSGHKHLLRLALLFGIFQGGMLLAGWAGGNLLMQAMGPAIDWLAALLLVGIGVKMLKESREEESEEEPELNQIRDYFILSIATSIDALAAGISLPSLHIPVLMATLMTGFTSLGMALIGGYSGKRLGEHLGSRAEMMGGLVLIGLGIKVLLT